MHNRWISNCSQHHRRRISLYTTYRTSSDSSICPNSWHLRSTGCHGKWCQLRSDLLQALGRLGQTTKRSTCNTRQHHQRSNLLLFPKPGQSRTLPSACRRKSHNRTTSHEYSRNSNLRRRRCYWEHRRQVHQAQPQFSLRWNWRWYRRHQHRSTPPGLCRRHRSSNRWRFHRRYTRPLHRRMRSPSGLSANCADARFARCASRTFKIFSLNKFTSFFHTSHTSSSKTFPSSLLSPSLPSTSLSIARPSGTHDLPAQVP
nr:MAG TPA: hypothetical protein [Cressdnaviricota sp.]